MVPSLPPTAVEKTKMRLQGSKAEVYAGTDILEEPLVSFLAIVADKEAGVAQLVALFALVTSNN